MASDTEPVLNLWCVVDPTTGIVCQVMGRVYVMDGVDDAKIALLRQLAVSDYMMAKVEAVPDRFQIQLGGECVKGVAPFAIIKDQPLALFEGLIENLQAELTAAAQEITAPVALKRMRISNQPLYVITALKEDELSGEFLALG